MRYKDEQTILDTCNGTKQPQEGVTRHLAGKTKSSMIGQFNSPKNLNIGCIWISSSQKLIYKTLYVRLYNLYFNHEVRCPRWNKWSSLGILSLDKSRLTLMHF